MSTYLNAFQLRIKFASFRPSWLALLNEADGEPTAWRLRDTLLNSHSKALQLGNTRFSPRNRESIRYLHLIIPSEAYRSAARIFRRGDARGGVCFTKDGAYLEGLLLVTAFIRRALQENRSDTLRLLFCGRVDLVTLVSYRGSGLIAPPRYVPPCEQSWLGRSGCLQRSRGSRRIPTWRDGRTRP